MNERAGKQNIEMDVVKEKIQRFTVEIPSWGYGDSGTRFKVFHWPGAARTLREKLEDAAQVNTVTGVCPSVAMHIHWDTEDDWQAVKAFAQGLGLRIGAVNPNLLQEDAYRLGSLSHIDKQVRKLGIAHASRLHWPSTRISLASGWPTAPTIPARTACASDANACWSLCRRSTRRWHP
jgi:L-rhamnose isomerase